MRKTTVQILIVISSVAVFGGWQLANAYMPHQFDNVITIRAGEQLRVICDDCYSFINTQTGDVLIEGVDIFHATTTVTPTIVPTETSTPLPTIPSFSTNTPTVPATSTSTATIPPTPPPEDTPTPTSEAGDGCITSGVGNHSNYKTISGEMEIVTDPTTSFMGLDTFIQSNISGAFDPDNSVSWCFTPDHTGVYQIEMVAFGESNRADSVWITINDSDPYLVEWDQRQIRVFWATARGGNGPIQFNAGINQPVDISIYSREQNARVFTIQPIDISSIGTPVPTGEPPTPTLTATASITPVTPVVSPTSGYPPLAGYP